MSRILCLPYPETGHLNPTFKLLKTLKSRGHEVSYLALLDFQDAISAQGLDFIPVFARLCPRGFIHEQAGRKGILNLEALLLEVARAIRADGVYDPFKELAETLGATRPDLLLIDNLLPQMGLIAQRLGLPSVLLNTQLFNPWEDESMYEGLLRVPEVLLCPREFDFPREQRKKRCYYVESSIDLERSEVPFAWDKIDERKRLAYCSLGSQGHLIPGSRRFMQTVIDAVALKPEWQLVLSTGSYLRADDFTGIAPNVLVVARVPQIEILKRTSVVLTHGGFNTIKECIFFGVPMIVFPVIRDHPPIAARVVHHGLGVRGNMLNISVPQIHSLIDRIEGDPSFKTRVTLMAAAFKQVENSERGAHVVEMLMAGFQHQDDSRIPSAARGLQN